MSSPRKFALLALGVLLSGGALLSGAQLGVGDRLPSWEGMGLEGKMPVTAGRVVLVDFWASWCLPCAASFPDLAKIHQAYEARGVTLVGIGVDQSQRAYQNFLKKQAPPFSTVRDVRQEYVAAVGVTAMPTSFVVGRDGRIRAVFNGFHGEKTAQALRHALESALNEPASP